MTSRKRTTILFQWLSRSLAIRMGECKARTKNGLRPLAQIALLGIILCQPLGIRVCEAEDAADPYDVLTDLLMTRWKDGKPYAQNETTPAIFSWSEFPFDDKTFKKFNDAMDALAALPQERIEQYSTVKRALLQRHLWKVFDTTFDWDWWKGSWYWSGRKVFPKPHMARRKALQPKIASLIRRLALTEKQIHSLPNPMAATVKSGKFAQAYDPKDYLKPFLPADLYAEDGSWICLGEDEKNIPVSQHTGKLHSRSIFLQFIRLPGGRKETLEYIERIKKNSLQFPVGTQFALIEQPFVISKEGKLVLSPMIVSVQLRAYLNVGRRFSTSEDDPQITQCVAEFVMQPRELMKGNAVMRAIGPKDFRYEAGTPSAGGFSPEDPFASGEIAGRMPITTRLNLCMRCHGSAGARGVRTKSFRGTNVFKEISVAEISEATAVQKNDYDDWKLLQLLWLNKTTPRIDDAKLAALMKPAGLAKAAKPVENPRKFSQDPKLRASLIDRIETEMADELKNLHAAILQAEVAKISEMFKLDESDTKKLLVAARGAADSAVQKTRDSLKTSVANSTGNLLNGSDIDMSAFTLNGTHIRLAPVPKAWSSIKKTKVHNGSYIDADTGLWVNTQISAKVQRRAARTSISIGFYGSFMDYVRPTDVDVQNEEFWKKTISSVLTKEQISQYTERSKRKFKSTLVDMMLTALQFDLDLQDSQLPTVRKRLEERIKPDPTKISRMETSVGQNLQRVKAEDLTDILTKEQLNRFTKQPKSKIKSTMITLILAVLQYDLHLSDSQLPIVRKRLEERVNPDSKRGSIQSSAMRTRWALKVEQFSDILTESQQTLWRLTQGE